MNHFPADETSCHCGCGYNSPDPRLLELLEAIRAQVGRPLILRSLCRCPAHNRAIGGSRNSAHLRCLAADIQAPTSRERYEILRAAFELGIRRIEVASSWIHVDVDESLPQDIVFLEGQT